MGFVGRGRLISLGFSVIIFLITVLAAFCFAASSASVDNATENVNVYVVCLEGVNGSGVGNVSRVVEGVFKASEVGRIRYRTGEYEPIGMTFIPVYGEVKVNVSVTVITDWMAYKILVEFGSNIILVNAHGETLPIPADYAKEEWLDEIAYAMLYRNVTWVHVAGYPFYHYFHQESGEGAWDEEGFKLLMAHIGKNNATCWPPDYPGAKTDLIRLDPSAESSIFLDWCDFYHAFFVNWGCPLKELDFKSRLVQPNLYGGGSYYYLAAAIKFARENEETRSFGFYIHFGAGQTHDYNQRKTDQDYYGAYAAVAAAIRAHAMKPALLEAIHNAETAVAKAQMERRTKGLDEAIDLLGEAKEAYLSNNYDIAIREANKAKQAAEEATNPSFLESHGLLIRILSIVGVATAGSITIRWRNNRRKNSKIGCEEDEKA